jgi:hypothetical protein
MGTKCYWCPYVSGEDKREINRIRFALTRVLKEFNRQNLRYVAWLQVFADGYERRVWYRVIIKPRAYFKIGQSFEEVFFDFYYNIAKGIRKFWTIDGFRIEINCKYVPVVFRLALRLSEVFFTV